MATALRPARVPPSEQPLDEPEARPMPRTPSRGTKVLNVVCSPRGLASNTARISNCLIEAMRDDDDDLQVTTLDLFRADLPSVAGKNIETKYRLMTGQAPDDGAKESWSQIEKTIEQFLDTDVYVLTVPMWNLGIPYVLKYYIDAIVQPGYLFRYTPDGQAEGLVRGKKMVIVISSGGDYTADYMRPYNFVESYLRAIFGFVGITDITVFHAHGMDVSPDFRKAGSKATIEQARAYARSGEWRPQRDIAPAARRTNEAVDAVLVA
jgi:FMN-dependent NADH-azoreductase